MAVESRLQLQPYDTTVRYYVDGTNGLDGALGTSWATAWKTYAELERRLASVLAVNPTNLTIIVYVRGDLGSQNLTISGHLQSGARIHVVHAVDDWTEIKNGTVAAVAATTFSHALRELTFSAISVPLDASDEGRWIVLSDGIGNLVCYQILRVWNNGGTMTATLNMTSVPAWVSGGGATASIREPSMLNTGTLTWDVEQNEDAYSWAHLNCVLGVACKDAAVVNSGALLQLAIWQASATSITGLAVSRGRVQSAVRTSSATYQPQLLAQEWGLIGTDLTAQSRVGARLAGTTYCVEVSYGAQNNIYGYGVGECRSSQGGSVYATCCSISTGFATQTASFYTGNLIVRGGAVAYGIGVDHGSDAKIVTAFVSGAPAAGYADGMISVLRNGNCRIAATVSGSNSGAGVNLVAVKARSGGFVQFDGTPNSGLVGDDGILDSVDARVQFNAAVSLGAQAGGGPDLYVEGGSCSFFGNITKSATNPSGGGTAQPVLKVRRCAQVTQAAGSTFTLPAGSGNNTTDYGANGAIDIETCCDVALGLLAGGNAVATGTAVRVKKASRLAHAGAAPTWGAAALDQGGNAADEMPAAVTSDMAAGVPEDCWVLPGSA